MIRRFQVSHWPWHGSTTYAPFHQIGHTIVTWILAIVGGLLARVLYEPPDETALTTGEATSPKP